MYFKNKSATFLKLITLHFTVDTVFNDCDIKVKSKLLLVCSSSQIMNYAWMNIHG